MKEPHQRSVIKAVTWRVLASLSTMSIVQIFTGNLRLSLGIGVFEVAWKLALYYFHERAWVHIAWGKPHPLADLPVQKPLTDRDKEEIRRHLQELGYL